MARYSDIAGQKPLSPQVFHILLALAESDGPETGYGISHRVLENTQGAVRIGTGTLYEALHRLDQSGLIEEVPEPEGEESGRRRRFYRLTEAGLRAARTEAQRLRSDLAVADRANVLHA